ncbi:MAG TPA: CdaR family protein [Vicinamibacterales bacterium]|nr:CdaR family protein [Vicinamibacterales bacterium]
MAWHPFRNLGLKTAALGLGTLLWFTVSGQQVERTVSRVPVVYRNVPTGLQITGDLTEAVTVHVRGSENQISRLQTDEVSAVVDLADAAVGQRRTFPLRTDQVAVPAGVEVMWVDPAEVTLTLETAGTAVLQIKPVVDGQPAPGFAVSAIAVDPVAVTLAGPESRLRAATAATTEPVSIAGANTTVSAVVAVSPMDAELRLRDPVAARVTVTIVPESQVNARTFASRPVSLRNLGAGWQVTAVPVDVSVSIRLSAGVKDGIDERRVVPFVDLVGLGPGEYTLPVRVEPAPEFTVTNVSPAAVSVRIR